MPINKRLSGGLSKPTTKGIKPRFIRKAKLAYSNINANATIWDFEQSGNYIYAAGDTDGVLVFDVSDPTSPVHVATARYKDPAGTVDWLPITDVLISGNTLFACGRKIQWPFPSGSNPGAIAAYDITTPASISWISTLEASGTSTKQWLQGMAINGTNIFCAGQYDGMITVDVSTPASMSISGANTTGYSGYPPTEWETSRIGYHNGYVYCANHGFGVRILDVATPSSPGAVTDRAIDCATPNGIPMRIRDVFIDTENNYLYASPNTSGSGESNNNTERGLLVLDISSPTTIATDGSDWIHAAIHPEDVDTWNGQGDKPIMGIWKHENYVYLPNGQRGTAVFDVRDPTNPKYIGLEGSDTDDETNLYKTYVFKIGVKKYAIYGDAKEVTQKHNVYIDEILVS